MRTRSTGVISASSERIGLICSAPPSQAWALPMRPPRCRYSSVSRQNQIRSAARASRARATTASLSAPARGGRGGREHEQPSAAAGRFAVDHLDPLAEAALGEQRLGPGAAASKVPEMPPARWIETMSWPAVEQRLADRQEVADRGLGGGRQLGSLRRRA